MLVTTVVIGNILHFSVVVVLFNGHYIMPVFPTKSWVSLHLCIAHMSLMGHGPWFILTVGAGVAERCLCFKTVRFEDRNKSRLKP